MREVSLGWQVLGTAGEPRSIKVTNTDSAPLCIVAAAVTGLHAADFGIVGESFSNVEVHPGCSLTVDIQFKPSATGLRTATLTLVSDHGDVHQVPLRGTAGKLWQQAAAGAPLLVQEKLDVRVPVALEVSGESGVPEVECGRQWVETETSGGECISRLLQEFTVAVPVLVSVTGECGEDGTPLNEMCAFHAVHTVRVALPVQSKVTADFGLLSAESLSREGLGT